MRSWCRSCEDLETFANNNNNHHHKDEKLFDERNVREVEETSSEVIMPSSYDYLSTINPMSVPPSYLGPSRQVNNNNNNTNFEIA